MARLIARAQARRKPIELSILTTNPRARAFYARLGFVAVATTAERVRMRYAVPCSAARWTVAAEYRRRTRRAARACAIHYSLQRVPCRSGERRRRQLTQS
ncbi:MAG TPA: hypothetical protein VLX44_05505 [Xanthobacteraceae bacterium]|nr:hypothetical protein [Xanthobacteraceae bacterium]